LIVMKKYLRLLMCPALLLGLLALPAKSSAQSAPAIFVTLSTAQVASGTTPTAATTTTIAAPGTGWAYSAAAPVAGTTWNVIQRPNPSIPTGTGDNSRLGLKICNSATNIALTSASGTAAVAYLTTWIDVISLDSNAGRTEPSTGAGGNTVLGPNGLMDGAWRIYNGAEMILHSISGLTPGQRYYLYCYASTTSAGQGARFTLNAANVPGGNGTTTTFVETRGAVGGNVFVLNGSNYAPNTPAAVNAASTSTDTTTWGRLDSVVDATGSISFRTSKNATGVDYSNGFQLMPYPLAVFTLQPPSGASATVGGDLTLTTAATGDGTLTYQWRKGGNPITNGASGSGSTYSGVTSSSLTISGVSVADNGDYDLVVTNPGGSLASSISTVSVTSGAIAPSIVADPVSVNAATNGSTSFSVSANGTAPLTYQWQKSLNNVSFTDVSGAISSTLNLSALTTADAGYYRVVVTNSVSSATSASASLTIAPVIVTAPAAAIVTAGGSKTISVVADVGAGSPSSVTYVWKRGGVTIANGANISGAATANLVIGAVGVAESGVYTVTLSNSAGSVTSPGVYVGVATSQSVTLSPAAGASSINPDAPLVVGFSDVPRVGSTGKITVRRVSDDFVVETIDIASLATATNGSATYRYQSKTVGGSGGGTYNYMPVVVVGNEARISLKSGAVLAYGVSYYVTIEAGAILDSTGASLAPISAPAGWTFATKAAAPSAVPTRTTFTVAADGSGDFSTLQGALDFIPAGNTTPVRLDIKAGSYDEIINTGSRHNLTLVGAGYASTVIRYTNNNVLNGGTSGRVSFLSKGNDLLFRDLTIYNATPKGGSQAEALRSDGSRVVFVRCAFKSYQDTLLLGGSSYFLDCLVEGDTDYIWGGGTAIFKNCELRCLNPADLTQSRTPVDHFGFIFLDCSITKPAGTSFSYGLGRNSDNSNVAFIDCRMDTHISATAWSSAFGSVNLRNWEYNSQNLAGTAAIDVSQRVLSRQLTAGEAAILRIPANVYGLTTDGTPAGAQGGGWVPVLDTPAAPVIVTDPVGKSVAAGGSVTFTVTASGPAFTYQWRKGTTPIPGAVGSTYTISPVAYVDAGSYDCVVTNSAGGTTSASAALVVLSPVAVWAGSFGLDASAPGFALADTDGDGVANLLEYALGGNPTVPDTNLAPLVTMVEDAGGKHLVIEYVRTAAAADVSVSVEISADLASWTTLVNGVNADIEIIPSLGQAYNVDVNTLIGNNYTGLAVAPGGGTIWNSFISGGTNTLANIADSTGAATPTSVAITSSGGFSQWTNTAAGTGTPTPTLLMQDYLYGYTYTVTVGSLPAGNYQLYVYAHGDADSQTSTITLGASNGGGTKFTTTSGGNTFRDTTATGAEGIAYVKFAPTVSATGSLQFNVGPYLNGFQLVQVLDPETVRVTTPFTGQRLFARLRATTP
jgi:pectin methylesterase-like acyl-CoA thioesterase